MSDGARLVKNLETLERFSNLATGREKRIIGTGTDISGLKKIENELRRNMDELERFSKMTFGREQMMIPLKEEINQILVKLGKEEKYKIVER